MNGHVIPAPYPPDVDDANKVCIDCNQRQSRPGSYYCAACAGDAA